ncbi:MAG: GNAT family N-acetyltransferase, partial [Actinomycetia bacterium]|nr:GNAT family N-acetyltransferase [Actinomycetes bacterium]
VKNPTDLRLWQNTTAIGWGHTDPAKRRASNAFSLAAHAVDGEFMVLAFDPAHNEPVGCATTTIRDRLATLGGMSTVPAKRRQGVQAALIDYRLELAAQHGCDLAATSALTGGPSERNLMRHDFTPRFVIETYKSPLPI